MLDASQQKVVEVVVVVVVVVDYQESRMQGCLIQETKWHNISFYFLNKDKIG